MFFHTIHHTRFRLRFWLPVFCVGLVTVLAAVYGLGTRATPVQSAVQPYYSGDAVVYRGDIIVATTDSGSLELFRVTASNRFELVAVISELPETYPRYLSAVLRTVNGRLYAYATNGRYLSWFDVSNPANPVLVKRIKDNQWDWFYRLQTTDTNLVSIGKKQVKIWNDNLDVINAYANPDGNERIDISSDGQWLFDIRVDYEGNAENDFIDIIKTATRTTILHQPIVLHKNHLRDIFYDPATHDAYFVGDRVVKQINLVTLTVRNFAHESEEGFAADGRAGSGFVYFTDGIGLVKMNDQMEAVGWAYKKDLGIDYSWVIGLKVLSQNGRDRIVTFNNSNIAVLDEELNIIATYRSPEVVDETEEQSAKYAIAIALNTYTIAAGRTVNVAGAGFAPGEEVAVTFTKRGTTLGDKVVTRADTQGRFRTDIVAPAEFPQNVVYKLPARIDVRAAGLISERHISTALSVTE